MTRPDHYATLGVDPSASAAEIRAAYLKLMREHHPDRNPGPESVERAKAIIAAFKVLSDFDQRSYFDWDRRRDREAAEAAAAAEAPRWGRRFGLAASGVGLAAVGVWLLFPGADPERSTAVTRTAAIGPERQAAAPDRPVASKPAVRPNDRNTTVIRMRVALPEAAKAKAMQRPAEKEPPTPAQQKAVETPPVRVAAKPMPPVRLAAKPVPPILVAANPTPAQPSPPRQTRPTTDLASLDQFVMNFYGQSWRYGDAPKRNALEQTKAGFVARRGACVAEACKRDAYLRLMRDVSEIVETGKPKER